MRSHINREWFERKMDQLNARRVKKFGDRRPIFGVRISEDHGKTWKLKALCEKCKNEIEPPTRVKNEGIAGVMACEWCGCFNNDCYL